MLDKLDHSKYIVGKKFLVTGGTGSFGKYITQYLLENGAKDVTVFSRDEDKQYSMQFEFRKYKDRLRFYIGDIRDLDSITKATRNVDIVFHAAALKQIPSTEHNVIEAVRTNVLGASNVVDACIANGVDKVVAISTDKAVEPINTMGLTKALQERIFILGNLAQKKTKFSLVRYGNVVASRGSVIPQFKKQIDSGGPVTITHKDMTRFILTLSQAINLVFVALDSMVGGEIFIPKIAPLKIIDLAQVMVEEHNLKNMSIKEIGIRPGEKIHEALISEIESPRVISKKDHFILLPLINLDDISYIYKVDHYDFSKTFSYSSDQGPFLSKEAIKKILAKDGIFAKK